MGSSSTTSRSEPRGTGPLVPLAMLLATGTAYGLIFSLNRIAITDGIPFLAYVFWQTLGAGIVLLAASLVAREAPKLRLAYVRVYVVVGFFTLAFPYVLLTFIAPELPAGVIGLGGTLSPTITYVMALILAMDGFRWLRIGGICLGLAGVLVVVLPDTSLPAPGMAGWVLLSLLVPLSYAAGTIAAARLVPPGGRPLAMASGLLLASAAMTFPAMAGTGSWWFFAGPMSDGDWSLIGAVLVNALFFSLLFEIVRRAGPVFFSTQNYIATLAGIGWGILLLNERHSVWIWLALALLLAGLFLVTRRPPQVRART